jgi:tetratricopeptide (TPR) repeat protein
MINKHKTKAGRKNKKLQEGKFLVNHYEQQTTKNHLTQNGPDWREAIMLLLFVLLGFLIYSNTLESPFTFDDWGNIKNNAHIRLTKLTWKALLEAGIESPCWDRPLANISFALNYYFNGYRVIGYHLVNIVVHITTGILLYLFTKTTTSLSSLRPRHGLHEHVPFITAIIWLVHPIHTQSVTYISQRMNSMVAMFYVLSFLLYAKARIAKGAGKKRAMYSGCLISGILSLFSKPIAATLPFFILLYEWYFFQDLDRKWLKRRLLTFTAVVIFFLLLAFVYWGVHPVQRMLSMSGDYDFALTERVLTEFRVVIHYLSLLFYPHPSRLNLDYDFPLSRSLIDPASTLVAICAITGVLGVAIWIAKQERLLSFCILWFFGNLTLESTVIPLEIIYEHRTYLPSMFVSLLAVTLTYRHLKQNWLRMAIFWFVIILFSVWTHERNTVWRSEVTLWNDCVKKAPLKARPHYNLANALVFQGKVGEAISHYSEALRLELDFAKAHVNLGNVLVYQGRVEEAIEHYSEALRIRPDWIVLHNNLGNALMLQRKVKEAISHYTELLRIKPELANVHVNLGDALLDQGKIEKAIVHYSEALRINPNLAEMRTGSGISKPNILTPKLSLEFR